MPEKNSTKIDEKLYDRIIAVAYDDASLIDKFIVYMKAKKNPDIQKILNEFKATANAIQNIKDNDLPESVIDSVKQRISRKEKKEFFGGFVYSKIISRPLLSSGVVAIIIIAIAAVLIINQTQRQPQYTEVQMKTAETQLAESLAIVNKVFKKAERKFDRDVIPNIVNKNTDKGFNLINDLLIGG